MFQRLVIHVINQLKPIHHKWYRHPLSDRYSYNYAHTHAHIHTGFIFAQMSTNIFIYPDLTWPDLCLDLCLHLFGLQFYIQILFLLWCIICHIFYLQCTYVKVAWRVLSTKTMYVTKRKFLQKFYLLFVPCWPMHWCKLGRKSGGPTTMPFPSVA